MQKNLGLSSPPFSFALKHKNMENLQNEFITNYRCFIMRGSDSSCRCTLSSLPTTYTGQLREPFTTWDNTLKRRQRKTKGDMRKGSSDQMSKVQQGRRYTTGNNAMTSAGVLLRATSILRNIYCSLRESKCVRGVLGTHKISKRQTQERSIATR